MLHEACCCCCVRWGGGVEDSSVIDIKMWGTRRVVACRLSTAYMPCLWEYMWSFSMRRRLVWINNIYTHPHGRRERVVGGYWRRYLGKNRRQKYRENRSLQRTMIGALVYIVILASESQRASINGAVPVPSGISWWMKKGWGQAISWATGWDQYFEFPSVL